MPLPGVPVVAGAQAGTLMVPLQRSYGGGAGPGGPWVSLPSGLLWVGFCRQLAACRNQIRCGRMCCTLLHCLHAACRLHLVCRVHCCLHDVQQHVRVV